MLQSNFVIRKIERYFIYSLFLLYTFWIIAINAYIQDQEHFLYDYFTDTYGVIAGIGAVFGLINAFKWGGLKSVVGRSIFMFSLGLLSQSLGQISYAISRAVYGEEIPYPSFGDIFYFLTNIIYIYGIWLVGIASGLKFKLREAAGKGIFTGIMVAMVGIAYYFFLSTYEVETTDPLIIIIEVGYPIVQAISVALALICLLLSKKLLGGVMRPNVLLVLAAFLIQYVADTYFTYEYGKDMWYPGGISDYLYVLAYFMMAIALYKFGDFPDKIFKTRN